MARPRAYRPKPGELEEARRHAERASDHGFDLELLRAQARATIEKYEPGDTGTTTEEGRHGEENQA